MSLRSDYPMPRVRATQHQSTVFGQSREDTSCHLERAQKMQTISPSNIFSSASFVRSECAQTEFWGFVVTPYAQPGSAIPLSPCCIVVVPCGSCWAPSGSSSSNSHCRTWLTTATRRASSIRSR